MPLALWRFCDTPDINSFQIFMTSPSYHLRPYHLPVMANWKKEFNHRDWLENIRCISVRRALFVRVNSIKLTGVTSFRNYEGDDITLIVHYTQIGHSGSRKRRVHLWTNVDSKPHTVCLPTYLCIWYGSVWDGQGASLRQRCKKQEAMRRVIFRHYLGVWYPRRHMKHMKSESDFSIFPPVTHRSGETNKQTCGLKG